MIPPPYPPQVEASAFLRNRKAMLADPPGRGKGRSALDAAQGRTLIVAPRKLEGMWTEQVGLWQPGLDYEFVSFHGLSERVAQQWDDGTTTRIATKQVNPKLRQPWDTVIVDEAHYLKNHRAKWTASFEKLSANVDQMSLLTGTPIPNWAHEIYETLVLIYGKKSKTHDLNSYWRWVWNWFEQKADRHSMFQIGHLLPDDSAESWAVFASQLDGHYLRRDTDLGIPLTTDQTIMCPMAAAQRKAYESMRKELLAEVGPETVVAWNHGSAHTKLLMMTTGLEAVSETKSSGKLDILQEIMIDRATSPTLLFGQYAASLQAIKGRLPKGSAEIINGLVDVPRREQIIAAWRRGDFPHIVGSYGTVADGYTFNEADTVIRVEAHPRAFMMDQAAGRHRRYGQTRCTWLLDLVCENSVDASLREMIRLKSEQSIQFLSALELIGGGK